MGIKQKPERRDVSRREDWTYTRYEIESRLGVWYLLLMTLLASLNVPFHASFVLHRHCLSTTVHGGNGVKHKKVDKKE